MDYFLHYFLNMIFTEEFWIFVAFCIVVIFSSIKMNESLFRSSQKRIDRIKKNISDAECMRQRAQNFLIEHQKKHKEALQLIDAIAQEADIEAMEAARSIKKSADHSIARARKHSFDVVIQAEVDATNDIRKSALDAAIRIVKCFVKEQGHADVTLIDDLISDLAAQPRISL